MTIFMIRSSSIFCSNLTISRERFLNLQTVNTSNNDKIKNNEIIKIYINNIQWNFEKRVENTNKHIQEILHEGLVHHIHSCSQLTNNEIGNLKTNNH